MKKLEILYEHFKKAATTLAGYPENQIFNYSELYKFFKFSINNCGDPFSESPTYRINTHVIERELIDELAKLFHAPVNHYWGYVTNGGSEGNLFGLYVARELYPNGIVYCSDQTHYSVYKNINLLKMRRKDIKSLPNGEIDYIELKKALMRNRKNVPIIVANIGTTMKGAVDQLKLIHTVLKESTVTRFFIHCDAALSGMILPYLPSISNQEFDFRAGIDSLAISGHKMIGSPIPCGAVLVKKVHSSRIAKNIEYIGTLDNTITGSRNGITPLFLWYRLVYKKFNLKKVVGQSIKKAEYAVKKFQKNGIDAWRNENSITVIFPRPSEKIKKKWQLAVKDSIAHIITLPQVTYKVIDQIVADVVEETISRS